MVNAEIKTRLLRISPEQNEFLKLKAVNCFPDISVHKYMIATLFPEGWKKELQKLKNRKPE